MWWWWRKVRRANLDPKLRDAFDALGIYAMTNSIANNYPPAPGARHAAGLNDQQIKAAALDWIREHNDREERHEHRLETVEWAILIFVVLGVVLDVAQLVRGH
jgi:hypothetical protein